VEGHMKGDCGVRKGDTVNEVHRTRSNKPLFPTTSSYWYRLLKEAYWLPIFFSRTWDTPLKSIDLCYRISWLVFNKVINSNLGPLFC
jgi:hypothetical protein